MSGQAYYVTAKEHDRVFFLAGPYETKEQAEKKISLVMEIACDFNRNCNAGRAAFMAYGVTRISSLNAANTALGIL